MRLIYFFLIIILFSGCANSQNKVEEFFQTDNATHIKKDYYEIVNLLKKYKHKLDKRNPQNYDKKLSYYIYNEFDDYTNELYLKENGKYIYKFSDYLKVAISDKKVTNRNDYLLLGIYKQVNDAYNIKEKIQISTFSYEIDKLKNLYYTLNVINWQIKHKRDQNGSYLFLTWQNNWQIELEQKLQNTTLDNIVLSQLENIRLDKESLLSPSNNSFEILTSKMILHMAHSIKMLNEEPENLSIDAILSVILII